MSVATAVTMTMREATWEIREYQSVDLAALMQHLHDTQFKGRLMLHYAGGRVTAAETCERSSRELEFVPAVLEGIEP